MDSEGDTDHGDIVATPAVMAISYVWRALGPDGLAQLSSRLDIDRLVELLGASDMHISYEETCNIARTAALVCHEDNIGERMGEELAYSLGDLGIIDALEGSPFEGALHGILSVFDTSTNVHDITIEPGDDFSVTISIRHMRTEFEEPANLFCAMTARFASSVAPRFGARATAVHTSCVARGDESCVIVIRWSPRASRDGSTSTWSDHVARLREWTEVMAGTEDPGIVFERAMADLDLPPHVLGIAIALRLRNDPTLHRYTIGSIPTIDDDLAALMIDEPDEAAQRLSHCVHAPIPNTSCDDARVLVALSRSLGANDAAIAAEIAEHVGAGIDAAVSLGKLRLAAKRDELTGLANRRRFDERIATLDADQRSQLLLAFIDLDGFKQINDLHGHAVGDELLRSVASRLVAHVRPSDLVVRLGGDEFVILAEGIDNDIAESTVRRNLEAALRAPYELVVGTIPITASIGLARAGDADAGVDDLLALADARMYEAKRARRSAQTQS